MMVVGQFATATADVAFHLLGLLIAYSPFFHGDMLASIFARDTPVIAAAADYLKVYAIEKPIRQNRKDTKSQVAGKPCWDTQGIVGEFPVAHLVSLFMSRLVPVSLFQVGLATPSSSLIQIFLCTGYFFLLSKGEALRYPTF